MAPFIKNAFVDFGSNVISRSDLPTYLCGGGEGGAAQDALVLLDPRASSTVLGAVSLPYTGSGSVLGLREASPWLTQRGC